ncbi:cytochrome d ubiquinol oxidase subunit II [Gorillibacterium timonense]|uniref:cytochrome d ubiquinol oxidase subunit II n=1 Tax=Gorillibacterium timonense TaxID=1689269 RepID=UPI00071D0BF3|nr:cytochrome d ubiquinol oxidase subunit II [Gorillibacterium timonense]
MNGSQLAITVIWVILFTYSILGSIDFGSGFWAMVYGRPDSEASLVANRFLSPSWKVTNVFLVLLVVALVGFFPHAAYMLGTILLLPAGLVLILLTIRSSFMVFSYSVSGRYAAILRVVSGVTGLLIPALLLSVLPISLGGFVSMDSGYPQLHFGRLLLSGTEYAHLAFGLATELFLSALFLASYAEESGREGAYRFYRKASLWLGPVTLIMAMLTALTFAPEASWIVPNMRRTAPFFSLSLAAFAIGYSALWWKGRQGRMGRPKAAVILIAVQYGLAVFSYGAAHMPYIVYPYLSIEQGFTNEIMFRQLLIGYGVSTLLLVPIFVWFWRLFFRDPTYLAKE